MRFDQLSDHELAKVIHYCHMPLTEPPCNWAPSKSEIRQWKKDHSSGPIEFRSLRFTRQELLNSFCDNRQEHDDLLPEEIQSLHYPEYSEEHDDLAWQ